MSAQRLTGQPRAIKAEAVEAPGSGGGPQSPGEHECRGTENKRGSEKKSPCEGY